MAGLLDIPGYGGFLQQGQLNDQQAQRRLQGVLGALQVAQGIEGMQDAPLKRQMLQAQVQGVLAQQKQQEEVNKLLDSLPPEQRALARIAPHQYVSGLLQERAKTQAAQAAQQGVLTMAERPGAAVMAPTNDVEAPAPVVNMRGTPGVLSSLFSNESPEIAGMARTGNELMLKGGFADVKDANAYVQKVMEMNASQAQARRAQQESIADRQMRQQEIINNRPPVPVTPVDIEDPNNPGKIIKIDARTGQVIGNVIPKPMEKALPTSAAKNLFENQQNLRRAEQALALLRGTNVGAMTGDKEATGVKGMLAGTEIGDLLLQRMDPTGVDTRAAIADLGSLIIHDRSGAAVTASEYPRLRPFIPKVTDDKDTAEKKLVRFVDEYRKTVQEAKDFYSESGYKVPDVLQGSGASNTQPPKQPTPRAGAQPVEDKFKVGTTYVDGHGRQRKYAGNGKWVSP